MKGTADTDRQIKQVVFLGRRGGVTRYPVQVIGRDGKEVSDFVDGFHGRLLGSILVGGICRAGDSQQTGDVPLCPFGILVLLFLAFLFQSFGKLFHIKLFHKNPPIG